MFKKKSKKTFIEIDLSGPDGNVFVILGIVSRLAKQLGEEFDPTQMMKMNYDDILEYIDKRFGQYILFLTSNHDDDEEEVVRMPEPDVSTVTCIDNVGCEESFEVGIDYILKREGMKLYIVENNFGEDIEVSKERFKKC